jgi:hypothetical protein
LNDDKGAVVDLTKAIEIKPEYAEAYFNRGKAKIRLEQAENGCQDLKKARDLGHIKAIRAIKELCE